MAYFLSIRANILCYLRTSLIFTKISGRGIILVTLVDTILKCISVGRTWNDIVKEFDDDEQLVSIWINYLKERNYLNAYSAVTDDGYSFLRNFTDSAVGEIKTLHG
jgi:hypothetical protein